MSVIRIPDRGGNCISFQEVDGYLLPPPLKETIFRQCRNLRIRNDDIILANWMRSGTHWLVEMISMLLNNNDQTIQKEKEEDMIENADIPSLDALASPRLLSTHLHFRVLPEDMKTKACRVVYLIRDPKDAAVSWYKMHIACGHYEYNGVWADWLPLFLEGKVDWASWFDHVRTWEHVFETHPNLNVHFVHYEDLKLNLIPQLQKLCSFLELDRSPQLLEAIGDKCHIDRMRQDKRAVTYIDDKGVAVHYIKGNIGGWKDYFTVAQYEQFQQVYSDKMKGSRFQARYE